MDLWLGRAREELRFDSREARLDLDEALDEVRLDLVSVEADKATTTDEMRLDVELDELVGPAEVDGPASDEGVAAGSTGGFDEGLGSSDSLNPMSSTSSSTNRAGWLTFRLTLGRWRTSSCVASLSLKTRDESGRVSSVS